EVAAAPQGREPGPQSRELLTKHAAAPSLQPIDDFSNAHCRISLNKDVDVIGHDLQGVDRHAVILRHFRQYLLQPLIERRGQDGTAKLGAPHDVVLQRKHRSSVLGVAWNTHARKHMPDAYITQ